MTKQPRKITNKEIEIGKRIQEIRIAKGLSRHQFADMIGVTHQQTQKYEKGTNRISIGRLGGICAALEVSYNDILGDFNNSDSELTRIDIDFAREFAKLNNQQKKHLVAFIRNFNAE